MLFFTFVPKHLFAKGDASSTGKIIGRTTAFLRLRVAALSIVHKTKKRGPDGSVCRGRVFHPTGHWEGGTQQLHRSMQEEVRPQYEDAVTKPSDCFPCGQLRFALTFSNHQRHVCSDLWHFRHSEQLLSASDCAPYCSQCRPLSAIRCSAKALRRPEIGRDAMF